MDSRSKVIHHSINLFILTMTDRQTTCMMSLKHRLSCCQCSRCCLICNLLEYRFLHYRVLLLLDKNWTFSVLITKREELIHIIDPRANFCFLPLGLIKTSNQAKWTIVLIQVFQVLVIELHNICLEHMHSVQSNLYLTSLKITIIFFSKNHKSW